MEARDKEALVLDDTDLADVNFDMMDDFISMMWPSNPSVADTSFNEWLSSNDSNQASQIPKEELMRSNVPVLAPLVEDLLPPVIPQYAEDGLLRSLDQSYEKGYDVPKIPPPQDYNAPKTYLHKMKPKTYSTKKEDYIMKPTKTEDTFVPEYYNNLQADTPKVCGKTDMKRVREEEPPIRPQDIILKAEVVSSCNEKTYRQLKVTKKAPVVVTKKNVPEMKHIAIIKQQGLDNNQVLLSTLKKKPVQVNKPIPKPKLPTLAPVVPTENPNFDDEEDLPPEKRTNHNAVERKYRYSINDKIQELKVMLMPKDTKIQKSGVLRKAIESIQYLQTTNQKLKFDNIQLKKKQDILEKNNHLLTLKIAEQSTTSVVYLEKTPDLVEPQETYQDYNERFSCTAPSNGTESYTPDTFYPNYSYKSTLPDSPESLPQSDHEREMRHVRNNSHNSSSSGGYNSPQGYSSPLSDQSDEFQNKKRRVEPNAQRTLPVLCVIFCLGMFVPGLVPANTISTTNMGRTLLSYSEGYEPHSSVYVALFSLLVSFTLSVLLLFTTTRVKSKDLKETLNTARSYIAEGQYISGQRLLEQNTPSRAAFCKQVLLYTLSLSPVHTVARWLVRPQCAVQAEVLTELSQMQLLKKHYKSYEWYTVWCYALQGLQLTTQPRNLYLIMSLAAKNAIIKRYFFWLSCRNGESWLKDAKSLVLKNEITFKPEVSVYHTLALELSRSNLSQAVHWLTLSDQPSDVRRIECEALLQNNVTLSSVYSHMCPDEAAELDWLSSVIRVSRGDSLEINTQSPVTQAISNAFELHSAWRDISKREIEEAKWLREEVQPALALFSRATPSSQHHRDVMCVALDWVIQVQIGIWQRSDVLDKQAHLLLNQSLRVMEGLVGARAAYKVSLYSAVCRVMIGASPVKTKKVLEPLLPATAIRNYEQAAAVALCLKHLPSHLHSDNYHSLINVFAGSK